MVQPRHNNLPLQCSTGKRDPRQVRRQCDHHIPDVQMAREELPWSRVPVDKEEVSELAEEAGQLHPVSNNLRHLREMIEAL